MKFSTRNSIPYFQYLDVPECIAGISTRNGGVSTGIYNSLNVGLHSNDSQENVRTNRKIFFDAVTPQFSVVNLKQTHSNIVHKVDNDYVNNTIGDAFYTTQRGVLLTISLADCGSVVFHDEDFTIIAALHCGWRGTKDGIIENTIAELCKHVKAEKLTAYIGPTIQQQYYEVGSEFNEYFDSEYIKQTNGKYYFNLNGRIEDILVNSGIGRVMNSRMGTFGVPDHFYSYRRDGETGRMCAFIGLV